MQLKMLKMPKIPKVSISKNVLNVLLTVLFIAFFCMGYFLYLIMTEESQETEKPELQPIEKIAEKTAKVTEKIEVQKQETQESAATLKKQPSPKPVAKKASATNGIDIAQIYPFKIPTANVQNSPEGHVPAPTQHLPAIPAIPNAGFSTSLPPIPPTGTVSGGISYPLGDAQINGVITGDDGSNMAIMSNGKVVKEGETYRDSRIAVIGGDGITLENGEKISYGLRISKK